MRVTEGFAVAYLLLARVTDVLVGLKQGPDVDCLAAPDLAVDSPIKRQLQGASVKRPVTYQSIDP